MKKHRIIYVGLIFFLVAGCANDPRGLDGDYVKDASGNIYQLEATIGDNYFVIPISDVGEKLDAIRGN